MENLQDMLRIYYKRIFPYDPYFQWLTYGSSKYNKISLFSTIVLNVDLMSIFFIIVYPNYLEHREFSFTLEGDVYQRYQSFSNQEEFENAIKQRLPHKIDIGAVFSLR